jgi:hypothetical protein
LEKLNDAGFSIGAAFWSGHLLQEALVTPAKLCAVLLVPFVKFGFRGALANVRRFIDLREPSIRNQEMLESLVLKATGSKSARAPKGIAMLPFSPSVPGIYRFPKIDDPDGAFSRAVELNCVAFSSSIFADSYARKLKRNKEHQEKNPFAIMLVQHHGDSEDANDEPYIGFTHLLPVSESVYRDYTNGNIKDNDFCADDVCSLDEEAYGIIVFSLGMDRYKLKQLVKKRGMTSAERLLAQVGTPSLNTQGLRGTELALWEGVVVHLHQLLDEQRFYGDSVRLLAQNLNTKVASVLRLIGFKQLNKKSGDGDDLFELKVSKPTGVARS